MAAVEGVALAAACEAVEWPRQPLGFESLALRTVTRHYGRALTAPFIEIELIVQAAVLVLTSAPSDSRGLGFFHGYEVTKHNHPGDLRIRFQTGTGGTPITWSFLSRRPDLQIVGHLERAGDTFGPHASHVLVGLVIHHAFQSHTSVLDNDADGLLHT